MDTLESQGKLRHEPSGEPLGERVELSGEQRGWGLGLMSLFIGSSSRPLLALWLIASVLLAISAASYGALVGPLLRVAFGGAELAWPALLEPHLPPPPSLDQLRAVLPQLIAGVAALKALAHMLERLSLTKLAISFAQRRRAQALDSLRWLSVDEGERRGEASLLRLLTSEIEHLERWALEGLAPLLRDGLQVLTLATTAALLSGQLGLWVMTLYPLLMWPLLSLRKRLKMSVQREVSAQLELSRWALAHLKRLWLIRVYQREPLARQELARRHESLAEEQLKRARALALAPVITELSAALLIAGGLSFFLTGVVEGRWRAEQLLTLFVCLLMMYQPLKSLSRAHAHWLRASEVERRLLTITQGALRMPRAQGSQDALNANAQGALKRWRLSALVIERGGVPLSDPLELSLSRGEVVRVTGRNGAGKSALLYQLLCLNPSRGSCELWVDEQRVQRERWREVTHSSWAWLPQHSPLLASDLCSLQTLYDELQRAATLEPNLRRLLQLLGVSELMAHLNASSHQLTLEGLSGGERQRLALALSLASPRPFVALDEPEAHLDEPCLEALTAYLDQTRARRALLLITHHSLIASLADRSLELPPLTAHQPPL